MTTQTIWTAIGKEEDPQAQVYVMEANPEQTYDLANVHTIHYSEPFIEIGYNGLLNRGARQGNQEFIVFCNNDLRFEQGWTKIANTMDRFKLASASPLCPRTGKEYGWAPRAGVKLCSLNTRIDETRSMFCGWCFVWRRSVWEKLGGHDERRKFWSADNASLQQLKQANLRHGLDTNAIVHHEQSQTLDTLDKPTRDIYEWNEIKKYNRDYKKDKFRKQLGNEYNRPKNA